MSKMMTLIKTNLNVNLGISAMKYTARHDKKKLFMGILIGFGIVMGIGPFIAMYSLFMNEVFKVGYMLNQPEIILTIAILMAQMLVFFFGIFYVMSVFYFSDDLTMLVPLPLKPYEVLGSKLAVVMVYEYVTLVPILLPPLLIYGFNTGQGVAYWIKGLLVIATSPLLPLVLATLLIVLLMRIVNFRKRKDLLAMVGGILVVLLAFGFNFLVSSRLQEMEPSQITELLTGQMGLVQMIGERFPPSIWGTLGISLSGMSGIYYMSLFIGSAVLMLLFLLWISNQVFYKGLIAGQEAIRKGKVLSEEKQEKIYSQTGSPIHAVYLKEWRLLMRTPVYVLNGLGGAFFGPLTFLLLYFGGQQTGLEQIIGLLTANDFSAYVVLIGAGLVMVMSALNMVSSTALSREGKDFWISKMIPVSAKDQIKGKLLHGAVVSLITVAANLIVLFFIFRIRPEQVLLIVFLGMVGSYLFVVLDLIIDVSRPKLQWSNPQEAVKQNLNAIFGTLATLIVMAGLFFLTMMLLNLNWSPWVIYVLLTVLLLLFSWLCSQWLYKIGEKKYREIEM